MNTNQKGFGNIILIILVVVLIGAVGYLTLVKKPTSLPEIVTQAPSPIPTPRLIQPSSLTSVTKDIDLAKQALVTYFNLLKTKQYSAAVAYHGSGYETLQYWNPVINPNDHVALLKNGCEVNGWQCLKIKNVLNEQEASPLEFKFIVQFNKPEWSTDNEIVFTQGPCCGAEDTGQRKTDFEYTVKKVNGDFIVVTSPIYVP